jgi:hypothetical protein
MATSDAIYGLTTAIKTLLFESYPSTWGKPVVSVIQPTDISNGIENNKDGLTVSLYRVSVSGTQRSQTPRRDEKTGKLYQPSRLVDLHYLITPWAGTPEKQHQILGWLINLIEDHGVVSSAQLNRNLIDPDTFGPAESVQINFESLALSDHFNLWDKLRTSFPASVTCVARMVALDSTMPVDEAIAVKTRRLKVYQVEQA